MRLWQMGQRLRRISLVRFAEDNDAGRIQKEHQSGQAAIEPLALVNEEVTENAQAKKKKAGTVGKEKFKHRGSPVAFCPVVVSLSW